MTLPDPIYVIVDGHAVLVSTEPSLTCACGEPTGSPARRQCRPCLHAEIAANTARLREKHPEVVVRPKGFRDRRGFRGFGG